MRKPQFLCGAAAALLCAGTALGAIGVANPGQQGSLLLFPRIAVQDGMATLVRIANNSENPVRLKCFWVEQGAVNVQSQFADYPDAVKETRDFAFDLTRNQAIWFNARDGRGSISVPPFPAEFGNNGELLCFATDAVESREIRHNHLIGNAELLQTSTGDTSKYSAYAFALTYGPRRAGELRLNFDIRDPRNTRYDSCSEYMVANFTPQGAILTVDGAAIETVANTLHWAGCDQNLRFDTGKSEFIPYGLAFEVWNADRVKLTGAFERGDSSWEVDLALVDRNALYFTVAGLGSNTGYFRAREETGRGLLGILQTAIRVTPGAVYTHATNTSGAGSAEGTILYEPGDPFPELPARH